MDNSPPMAQNKAQPSLAVDPHHPAVHPGRDALGRLVSIGHLELFDLAVQAGDPQALADAYLQANAGLFGVTDETIDIKSGPDGFNRDDGTKIRHGASKRDGRALSIGYTQLLNNVPVWGAGLEVLIIPSRDGAHRVVGASSGVHFDPTGPGPGGMPGLQPRLADDGANPGGPFMPGEIPVDYLQQLINAVPGYEPLRITTKPPLAGTLCYHRYDPGRRVPPPLWGLGFFTVPPDQPPPPPADDKLIPDLHYLAAAIYFLADATVGSQRVPTTEYQAFVSIGTGQLLALRTQAAACLAEAFHPDPAQAATWARGKVLSADPYTQRGAAAPAPPIQPAALDLLFSDVPLDNISGTALAASLSSNEVTIVQLDTSATVPPTDGPGGIFDDTPSTNAPTFSNVTLFYHIASLFRMLQQLNMDGKYSQGELSVWADSFDGGQMQGRTRGFTPGDQHDQITFGRLHNGSLLSAGLDVRLVLHEFSHLLIWRSTTLRNHGPGTLNLGFAHSFGDSLAAILIDPCSALRSEPDDARFTTFPWFEREYTNTTTNALPAEGRFHGGTARSPAFASDSGGGWAWWSARASREAGGPDPGRHYDREQMLSTSLFRAYRALGGDSTELNQRLRAATYMAYLIIRACWLLPLVGGKAGTTPEDFVLRMRAADVGDRFVAGVDASTPNSLFGNLPGGAVHKVVAWAFEEQGLFVPQAPLVPCGGRGPNGVGVDSGKGQLPDLYIGADRAGYLPYREGLFDTTDDVWNRNAPDGLDQQESQPPSANQPNFVYVRVRNRGAAAASPVTVDVHWRLAADPLLWDPSPGAWNVASPPDTIPASVPAADASCEPSKAIFGPFSWTPPEGSSSWVLLASVSFAGDHCNIDPGSDLPCANNPILVTDLLPYDNNLAILRLPLTAPT